jgi:hypothetical protein
VNTLEDRVRAATEAIAGTVAPGSAPPLRLPASPPPRRVPGRIRRWAHWLTPAAAALAVAAVVLGSLALQRGQAGLPVSPAPLPGGLPRYYAALVQEPSGPWWAEVRATVTGRVLGTVRPPLPFTRFSEVAAAPDDHTFVLAGIGPQGQPSVTQLYALRLNPATGQVRLSRLPIPLIPERWRVNALAVSPDGTRLAVALEPAGAERPRLQLYSMTSGALLREWGVNTTRPGAAPVIGFMSWAADGRTLEYSYPLRGNGAALLDVTRPGTNLLGNSTIVQFPKRSALTGNLTMTGGGRLIASAAYITSGNGYVTGWLAGEFSARTGKTVHVLYRRAFHRSNPAVGPGTVWWASPAGQVLIASPARHGLGANQAYTGLAVFTGHRYIPLPWSGRITEAAW